LTSRAVDAVGGARGGGVLAIRAVLAGIAGASARTVTTNTLLSITAVLASCTAIRGGVGAFTADEARLIVSAITILLGRVTVVASRALGARGGMIGAVVLALRARVASSVKVHALADVSIVAEVASGTVVAGHRAFTSKVAVGAVFAGMSKCVAKNVRGRARDIHAFRASRAQFASQRALRGAVKALSTSAASMGEGVAIRSQSRSRFSLIALRTEGAVLFAISSGVGGRLAVNTRGRGDARIRVIRALLARRTIRARDRGKSSRVRALGTILASGADVRMGGARQAILALGAGSAILGSQSSKVALLANLARESLISAFDTIGESLPLPTSGAVIATSQPGGLLIVALGAVSAVLVASTNGIGSGDAIDAAMVDGVAATGAAGRRRPSLLARRA